MNLVSMLRDAGYALISTFKGMAITARNLRRFRERKQTVMYPLEEVVLPPTYRGALVFLQERCIVCELCEKACPVPGTRTEKTIELYHHVGPSKKRELDEFYIDYASCINCYLCVEACPVDALLPGASFELATVDPLAQYDRSRMIYGMRQLAVNPESAAVAADAAEQGKRPYDHIARSRPIKALEVLGESEEEPVS